MIVYQDEIVKQAPNIIEQAAKSPLGILALIILVLAVLAYFFFRNASETARIAMFVMMFMGGAAFGCAVVWFMVKVEGGNDNRQTPTPTATPTQSPVATPTRWPTPPGSPSPSPSTSPSPLTSPSPSGTRPYVPGVIVPRQSPTPPKIVVKPKASPTP
jgi:hypothetical protein